MVKEVCKIFPSLGGLSSILLFTVEGLIYQSKAWLSGPGWTCEPNTGQVHTGTCRQTATYFTRLAANMFVLAIYHHFCRRRFHPVLKKSQCRHLILNSPLLNGNSANHFWISMDSLDIFGMVPPISTLTYLTQLLVCSSSYIAISSWIFQDHSFPTNSPIMMVSELKGTSNPGPKSSCVPFTIKKSPLYACTIQQTHPWPSQATFFATLLRLFEPAAPVSGVLGARSPSLASRCIELRGCGRVGAQERSLHMGTLEPRDVAGELEEGPNIFGITFKTSWTLMESTSPTVCKKNVQVCHKSMVFAPEF